MTWLIVGLGNPGPQYANNRHNIGFMVLDRLAAVVGGGFREKFHGHMARGTLAGKDVTLLKPMTWMNLSGTSVGEAGTFFKAAHSEVIIIHDELDLASCDVKVKIGGGHAGHNGLRSIFEHFGKDFVRVRCGIGRPKHGDVTPHVLGDFRGDDLILLPDMIDKACKAVELILDKGALAAQNATNPKPKPPAPKPPRPPAPAAAAGPAPAANQSPAPPPKPPEKA